jgi:hypothetical protein
VNPDPQQDFTASWGFIEWAIGAAWTAGMVVAGFVWRLATRVEMLEREQIIREKADDDRHKENVHIMRGMQQQMHGMIIRIDDIFKSLGRRPNRED